MVVAERTTDIGRRSATTLSNGLVRTVIADKGAMIPDFSYTNGEKWINSHWNPHFRSNSGLPFDEKQHGDFWQVELLYELAGNFPCLPNFGVPCQAYDHEYPVHGPTSNGMWRSLMVGVADDNIAYSVSQLSPEDYPSIPLTYTKYDIMLPGQPVHYMILKVKNQDQRDFEITAGWHNTLGSPFVEAGNTISLCGNRFATAPVPSEFDDTGQFAQGVEFDDIHKTPMRNGGTFDASVVPGMIGYTDFLTAAVPLNAEIGWSSMVNPRQGAIYMSWFLGPASKADNQLILYFNDLWLQYGGRSFTPWANQQGGTDLSYCVGAENATGAYANGLEFSLNNRELLGNPTLVKIPAGREMTLSYAVLLTRYDEGVLDKGIGGVEPSAQGLILEGNTGKFQRVSADPLFEKVGSVVEAIGP